MLFRSGQLASKYTRRDVAEEITEDWNFTGNITGQGEIAAYQASDKRLKSNIHKLHGALSIVDKLTPVAFNWNSKAVELNPSKNTKDVHYSLIAQEVEEVIPELSRQVYTKYKTYDDRGLTTILLQAIKELKVEVDELKDKLNKLK